MNNYWNQIVYKIWSPVYDRLFNTGSFLKVRKQMFSELTLKQGQKILFVGVGTGADLELINQSDLDITAIDLSEDMLNKARLKETNSTIKFIQMDAQNLTFPNETFDVIIANLILSVVPNPNDCLKEMDRVVTKHGVIHLFDKFAPKDKELSLTKKLLRPIIRLIGTDIGIHFETLYSNFSRSLEISEDEPVLLGGMYRKIQLRKL